MNPITHTITEVELSLGERIFIAPTGALNVVSIQGSVLGGWSSFARSKMDTALLTAELLDAGTKSRPGELIRESLSSRGASILFNDTLDRTYFVATCFPEDLSFVLMAIAECFTEALLPADELANAKKRALGFLEESLNETKTQASSALSRLLFDSSHVNYIEPTKTRMKYVDGITRSDLQVFRKGFGRRGLVLAIVGDVETTKARKAAEKAFGQFPAGRDEITQARVNTKKNAVTETLVPIKDKANIDTFLGVGVPFTHDSPEYLPFVTLSSMLGGRGLSTGHLMRTIRERDGYTYGIYAQQSGFAKDTQGAFRIWATFSPANFHEAVAATRKEIDLFLKNGITEGALETKKDEATGNYLIGLSTTRGLAIMLHTIGLEAKPLSYIDAFPSLIRAITLNEVKSLAPLIASKNLSVAASGTFPKI